MAGYYETHYDGDFSDKLSRKITVKGEPRSAQARGNIRPADMDSPKHRKVWKENIKSQISKQLKHELNSSVEDEYNLYMVFRLLDKDKKIPVQHRIDNRTSHNPYKDKDLDNLLKLALDAIKETPLIPDDSLIKGIKAYKEPVSNPHNAGLSLQCVTTKTFIIKDIEPVAGEDLMPGHWKYDMQLITAEYMEGDERKDCSFIDNSWGRIFIAKGDEKKYFDSIPGYNWGALKGQAPCEVNGCIVVKREHTDDEGITRTFHWLHKWAWW